MFIKCYLKLKFIFHYFTEPVISVSLVNYGDDGKEDKER